MKRLFLPVLFTFATLCTQAQLSAEKYDLKTRGGEIFECSTSFRQSPAYGQKEGFFEKKGTGEINSSRLTYGIIAGPTLFNTVSNYGSRQKMKSGVQLGVIGTNQLNKVLGLKTGLAFTQKGLKDDFVSYIDSSKVDVTETFNYLNIPLLATVNVGRNIRFYGNAGPVLGIWMGGKSKQNGESENIADMMNPVDLSALFGCGAIFPLVKGENRPSISLMADVNYQVSLTGIYNEYSSTRNSGFTCGLGVIINATEAFESASRATELKREAKEGNNFKSEKNKFSSLNLGYGIIVGPTLFKIADSYSTSEMKVGMQLGLIGTYQRTESFGYKTGLVFTQKGFHDNYYFFQDSSQVEATETFNYLNIPFLVTQSFGSKLRFYGNVGPVVGILLGGKSKWNNETEKYTTVAETADLAILMGGGVIVPVAKYGNGKKVSLLADFNYQLGIADTNGSYSDTRNQGFAFAIGVLIGGI